MTRERPLDIVILSAPDTSQTGDFVYRVRQPGRAMSATGQVRVVTVSAICGHREELVARADVLIVDMVGDADLVREVSQREGPTIYEMSDNIFDIQAWNAVHGFFSDQHNQSMILQLISMSQSVQTTSEHLSELFRAWHPQVHTFPNQLRTVGELPAKGEHLTIGWGGSFGHLGDIEAVAPAITSWLSEHPEVRLHMMCDERIFDCFADVPAAQKRHFQTGPLEAYEAFLDTVDIGFVPIEERGFNLCRSDVKFLEFCAHGVVPVAARIGPYAHTVRDGDTGILYDDTDGLIAALEALAGDPERVERLRIAGHAYVRDHRQEHHHVPERLSFIEATILDKGGPLKGDGLGDLLDSPRFKETSPGYFEVPLDTAEQAVYDGLALQTQGKNDEAIGRFDEALRLEPLRVRPSVFRANAALAAGDTDGALKRLEELLSRRPDTFEAQLLMVFALHRAQRHDDARDHAMRTWEEYPHNARLGMLHAQQLSEHGATAAQIAILETVVEECPGYFVSWSALGFASFKHQRFAVARELLIRFLKVIPSNVDARFALAASELRLGRIGPGRAQLELLLELQPDHVTARQLLQRLSQGDSS